MLARTLSVTTKKWSHQGVRHDLRGLKQRDPGAIPGAHPALARARNAGAHRKTPAQVSSSLAGHPSDLRHAAPTTWLNAGVATANTAKRAGDSVEVLLRRYAGGLDNQAELINRRIEQALDEQAEPGSSLTRCTGCRFDGSS